MGGWNPLSIRRLASLTPAHLSRPHHHGKQIRAYRFDQPPRGSGVKPKLSGNWHSILHFQLLPAGHPALPYGYTYGPDKHAIIPEKPPAAKLDRPISYGTIQVPVSPARARAMFSGSVIKARWPPCSMKRMMAAILGPILPLAKCPSVI